MYTEMNTLTLSCEHVEYQLRIVMMRREVSFIRAEARAQRGKNYFSVFGLFYIVWIKTYMTFTFHTLKNIGQ